MIEGPMGDRSRSYGFRLIKNEMLACGVCPLNAAPLAPGCFPAWGDQISGGGTVLTKVPVLKKIPPLGLNMSSS
jgi:hypothetical protein